MVSLQAEITTCSRPPQQALLYLQNKKLLGFEHRGERDPAENHPLVQVVNTLCCWLCVWGREEGSSWSGSLVGGCWSRLDKCPPPRCLVWARTVYACSWLSLLMICVNTVSPKPGRTISLQQLTTKVPVPGPAPICCRYNLCSVTHNVKYNEHIYHLRKNAFREKGENARGSAFSFMLNCTKPLCFTLQKLSSYWRDLHTGEPLAGDNQGLFCSQLPP